MTDAATKMSVICTDGIRMDIYELVRESESIISILNFMMSINKGHYGDSGEGAI